jgi:hypothetical protein
LNGFSTTKTNNLTKCTTGPSETYLKSSTTLFPYLTRYAAGIKNCRTCMLKYKRFKKRKSANLLGARYKAAKTDRNSSDSAIGAGK